MATDRSMSRWSRREFLSASLQVITAQKSAAGLGASV